LAIGLGDVVAVVGRRADDLARGCDRAEKLDLADRKGLSISGRGKDDGLQPFEMGDQRVAFGSEWIDRHGQLFERLARVADISAVDEPQPIVVEPADPHLVLRSTR